MIRGLLWSTCFLRQGHIVVTLFKTLNIFLFKLEILTKKPAIHGNCEIWRFMFHVDLPSTLSNWLQINEHMLFNHSRSETSENDAYVNYDRPWGKFNTNQNYRINNPFDCRHEWRPISILNNNLVPSSYDNSQGLWCNSFGVFIRQCVHLWWQTFTKIFDATFQWQWLVIPFHFFSFGKCELFIQHIVGNLYVNLINWQINTHAKNDMLSLLVSFMFTSLLIANFHL